MSEMGFGYYGQPNEGQVFDSTEGNAPQPPAWYREAMKKFSDQIAEQKKELDALRAENTRAKVADQFEAKGYSRSAAALFNGEPDKVDEWLQAHGGALARTGGVQEETAPPAGPPATTVPLEGQQQMAQMQAAGADGTAPQGSADEVAAALAAARTPEDFAQIMGAHGWQHSIGDLY